MKMIKKISPAIAISLVLLGGVTVTSLPAVAAVEVSVAAQEAATQAATSVAQSLAAQVQAGSMTAQAAASQMAAAAQQAEKELLASLIFCEAGNQPYEGQVAVGAVVMNRINSSSYPDTMEEVIYQSGQFSPAMSGWLDRVRANQGYTEAAMQAAEDALAGSNPIGDCLYFSVGGYGTRIGDHLFH